MKILFVSSEIAPFAKTGGLGEISETLPVALKSQGQQICLFMPLYKKVKEQFKLEQIDCSLDIPLGPLTKTAKLRKGYLREDIEIYFIENDEFFDRDYLYNTPEGDYPDNALRFLFFCRSVLEMLKVIGYKPDIIHLNDWQTSFIAVYLKTIYKDDEFFQNIKVVLTIHNLAYQGVFNKENIIYTGLDSNSSVLKELEFWGKINFLKGGIVYSDIITTVSPRYSKEIQTPEFGAGLENVICSKKDVVFGIINGIDYQQWNPETDKYIAKNYNLSTIENKGENKVALLKKMGLPVQKDFPLLGMVCRLTHQKGIDLIIESLDELMKLPLQFVILGTGDAHYHRKLGEFIPKYPTQLKIDFAFDEALSHLIYAGSDFFLMPSKFEPCGLGQLIAITYGTAPIVSMVGGLADTIKHFTNGEGNGFVLKQYSKQGLIETVKEAISVYKNKELFRKLQENMMRSNFGWESSARQYIQLYQRN